MLIQAIPIISTLIAIPQAVALRPAPIYQRVSVVGILIVRSFQAILLIGGNADIFNDLILFPQFPQRMLLPRTNKRFSNFIIINLPPAYFKNMAGG